jgi:hypothetical protein
MFFLGDSNRCHGCRGEAKYLIYGPTPIAPPKWSCSKCYDTVRGSLFGEASLLDKAIVIDQAEQIIRASWLRNRNGLPPE